MNYWFRFSFIILLFWLSSPQLSHAQGKHERDTTTYDLVIKHDGVEFVGHIVSQDEREVIIETEKMGRIAIPKYEIKEIKKVEAKDISLDGRVFNPVFATRYFFSTNGLPIKKGESYIQWNYVGPDIQFAVSDRLGVGVMTSWIGVPLVGSIKYSIPVAENVNIGVGALAGTMSWANFSAGGFLPYGAVTFGNRRSNINFSGGYASFFDSGTNSGGGLLSVGGMTTLSPKISLVFDSFILPAEEVMVAAMNLRWQSKPDRAVQFGLPVIVTEGEVLPFPIPLLQWYRTIN